MAGSGAGRIEAPTLSPNLELAINSGRRCPFAA